MIHTRIVRSTLLLGAAALAALLPATARAEAGGLRCEPVSFPVTLSPGDATVYHVAGDLCSRGSVHHKTIQIALAGATYDHTYWDFPFQPETYSYVRRATAAGYAVLNLDRLGVGRSDRPAAGALSLPADAYVVHQVVQALRGGEMVIHSFGRIAAERVALVGHSLGSSVAIIEAADYGDVDGVVLTGISHTLGAGFADVPPAIYPASFDPKFAGQIPDGYLTTVPGYRGLFYHAADADPAAIVADEQTKSTITTGEFSNPAVFLPLSLGIHVPVLEVVGDDDTLFCGAPTCAISGSLSAEAAAYAPDACLETAIIPGAGHSLNLHLNAPATFDTVLSWLDRRVGGDTHTEAPQPCQP
jgi:pimeloyl-ACP methyl ester carboxylesterase